MINPFIGIINSLLPEPHASLLNGILFGVRSTMPKSLYNALITTGTLHIIALSGMNITILVNLMARITLFMGRKVSILLTTCLIVIFVLFVGASPTIVRAAIMGSLSLLSVYFGRLNYGLLTLFIAAGIMILFNSSLVNNLSFQLSFFATFGIILVARNTRNMTKKGLLQQSVYTISENFKITLSAQIFTLPIILYNFRRLSLISPLANLLIEWTIQPIMVLGLTTAILAAIWACLVSL